jgi:hypothetical protein
VLKEKFWIIMVQLFPMTGMSAMERESGRVKREESGLAVALV